VTFPIISTFRLRIISVAIGRTFGMTRFNHTKSLDSLYAFLLTGFPRPTLAEFTWRISPSALIYLIAVPQVQMVPSAALNCKRNLLWPDCDYKPADTKHIFVTGSYDMINSII